MTHLSIDVALELFILRPVVEEELIHGKEMAEMVVTDILHLLIQGQVIVVLVVGLGHMVAVDVSLQEHLFNHQMVQNLLRILKWEML